MNGELSEIDKLWRYIWDLNDDIQECKSKLFDIGEQLNKIKEQVEKVKEDASFENMRKQVFSGKVNYR